MIDVLKSMGYDPLIIGPVMIRQDPDDPRPFKFRISMNFISNNCNVCGRVMAHKDKKLYCANPICQNFEREWAE